MKSLPKSIADWPAVLPREVAINETSVNGVIYTEEELCRLCGVTLEEYNVWKLTVPFRAAVREAITELKQNSGGVIRRKAEIQLEHWVDYAVPKCMEDPDVPWAEKLKALTILKDLSGVTEMLKMQTAEAIKTIEQPNQPATNFTILLQHSDQSITKLNEKVINQEAELVSED